MDFSGDWAQLTTPCDDSGVESARLTGVREPQQGKRRILREKDGEVPDVTFK